MHKIGFTSAIEPSFIALGLLFLCKLVYKRKERKMKIVVDDKIPYIRETLAEITPDTVYIKGSEITADDVRDADALIVRTRTQCDE